MSETLEDIVVLKMETTTPTCEKSSAVGNAAAMREALLRCDAIAQMIEIREYVIVKDMRNLIKKALSAPPRNCNVGTAEEQSALFDTHCRKHIGCMTCPLREKDGGVPKHCEFAWAQMPYKEEQEEKKIEREVKE